MENFNTFWCFMKLRPRTLHFWRFLCSPPTAHGIPVRKSDDRPSKRHQKANQNHDQNTGFLCRISSCCLGFMVDNTCTMWSVVNTNTLQKWRVRGLSFIKHQTLLKNSTWAWSYVDLEKVPFFFNGNLWLLCRPKIWQWDVAIQKFWTRASKKVRKKSW